MMIKKQSLCLVILLVFSCIPFFSWAQSQEQQEELTIQQLQALRVQQRSQCYAWRSLIQSQYQTQVARGEILLQNFVALDVMALNQIRRLMTPQDRDYLRQNAVGFLSELQPRLISFVQSVSQWGPYRLVGCNGPRSFTHGQTTHLLADCAFADVTQQTGTPHVHLELDVTTHGMQATTHYTQQYYAFPGAQHLRSQGNINSSHFLVTLLVGHSMSLSREDLLNSTQVNWRPRDQISGLTFRVFRRWGTEIPLILQGRFSSYANVNAWQDYGNLLLDYLSRWADLDVLCSADEGRR